MLVGDLAHHPPHLGERHLGPGSAEVVREGVDDRRRLLGEKALGRRQGAGVQRGQPDPPSGGEARPHLVHDPGLGSRLA